MGSGVFIALLFGVFLLFAIGGLKVAVAGIFLIIAGALTIFGQVAVFLYTGQWFALSGIDLLEKALSLKWKHDQFPWVFTPESWIGVHSLLESMPASITLVVVGFISIVLGIIIGLISQ